ncbi:PAS domain-containing sensor histidine kinase [Salinigranum sp. GCM10025319]|uniref:PAS domain-containing sensor histidine kinase n=1 Tax=Salinigranum sp. GCM10025319 TaxID=3252687 RepID=UPI00361B936B
MTTEQTSLDPTATRVLHVDEDPDSLASVADALERTGSCEVVSERTAEAGLSRLRDERIDCVVVAVDALDAAAGESLLTAVREHDPDVPLVLVSDVDDTGLVVEAVDPDVSHPDDDGQVRVVQESGVDTFDASCLRLLSTTVGTATSGTRHEQSLLAAFFENSGEPVIRVWFDGDEPRVDRVNPAFERVFGIDAAEIRGESLDKYVVPEDERASAAAINSDSLDGDPVEAEVRRFAADGLRDFLFRSVPFRGTDGDLMAYGIYVDITARKRRERELERYRTIVESTGDPVYTLDADGDITYVNEALESMTGYDAEALVGEHMRLLVPDDDVERSEALIRDLLGDPGRTNDTVEIDIVRADGSRVCCENHIALLPFDEAFQGTAGVIRDITERKERKRELEAQNERLDRFASVVSHDLRNPLQVAQGHLELLGDRLDGEEESFDRVRDALERMDALVDDVLTLAREGETVTEPEFVSLADTAHLAWASVDTTTARLDVDTDATVLADGGRLQRLFENLIRNSVEHGSTGSRPQVDDSGGVTVRIGTFAAEGPHGDAGFFVADDGPGIPAAECDRVFEAGYSTSDDGTGFGLDIVRSIASAHGWTVHVTESDRGGARFEFRIPADTLSG